MTHYRGSDGWIYDGGERPRRYPSREKIDKPPQRQRKKARPKKLYSKCPNCGYSSSWRRMEGYCTHCKWGKPEGAKTSDEPPVEGCFTCLGILGGSAVLSLVLAGMGYAMLGAGGLIAGFGLGLVLPVGVMFAIGASGAVYGLFGYLWIRPAVDPGYPIHMVPMNIVIMLGMLVACMTPLFENVANGAHLGGLFGGILAALIVRVFQK